MRKVEGTVIGRFDRESAPLAHDGVEDLRRPRVHLEEGRRRDAEPGGKIKKKRYRRLQKSNRFVERRERQGKGRERRKGKELEAEELLVGVGGAPEAHYRTVPRRRVRHAVVLLVVET